jgi:hypothetical protein
MESVRADQVSGEARSSLIQWILRIGVAGCFIGHGAFGIITKAAWVPYFAVADVSETWAWRLMPWIGTMDIAVGLLALLWPCRALFMWAAAWGVWTALLRPLSGESCWEFWERAGNFGVPIAIVAVVGWSGAQLRLLPHRWPEISGTARGRLGWTLRFVTFALLAGHAGCTLMEARASFAHNYSAVWPHGLAGVVTAAGLVELAMAAGVLLRPSAGLLIGVCAWKVATEALFVFAGSPVWEVVERFGSYTAPLALALLPGLGRADPVALAASQPNLSSTP